MGAVIRPPLSLVAAGVVVLVGLAGLVRGALPQSAATGSTSSTVASAPIVVSGAYVREPANGINAAAYFTVYNTTAKADTLTTVIAGAGAESSLHTENPNGAMQLNPNGVTIPAHSHVTLSPGVGHVMIEKLYGPLTAGQTVNLQLTFATAGEVLVTAPVIGITAPAPTGSAPK
jgi:copper(I)-binding protein